MKLRYYLRGMGVGIIVTTFIFMILILIHRNDGVQQQVSAQDTESKTVAEYANSTQRAEDSDAAEGTLPVTADTETLKPDTEPEEVPDMEPDPAPADQTEPEEIPENQDEPQADQSVQIEISNGQFSDTVCKMLQEAGLIEDAADFNNYLVENNYDNSIFPGVYDIPKDSTYEEIAVLLTRK